jgi:hypothetical protein
MYIHSKRLGKDWRVRGSNPGGGKIFRTLPDRPWGLHQISYSTCRITFPGVKWPGRGVNHPPPSTAEVKERVELYPYSSSGPSWPVLGKHYVFTNLGEFAKLRKATINYVKSVRLSVRMKHLGSDWTDFDIILHLRLFRKSVEKIQFSRKSNKNNGYFT